MKTRVSSKGQITVPAVVRRRLGLRPGTVVLFELRDDAALLRKGTAGIHPADRVYGTLRLRKPVDAMLDDLRGPRPRRA